MANFGLKYYCSLRSQYKGVYWRVEIAERDYEGASEEMSFAGHDPLRITWESRGDEFFVPIKASEASITILCEENFKYISLFTSDPRKYRVSIFRNTVLYWRGFVVADLYSESFAAPPYEVTIKAVDGFKLLSNIAFLAPDQTRWSGTMSLWQIISECLSLLELDISISDWMDLYAEGTNENESPLRQVYIDMERFYYVYEEPSYRDALELCLRPFAGQIFQSGGSLHIRRAISLYNANRPLSFYDVGSDFPSGWLVTADGDNIVTHQGEPIITTMSRERIDSMWDADINVLSDSSLEIVPAIRRLTIGVKNKMIANLIEQMGVYDLALWSDTTLLTLKSKASLVLKGDSDHLNEKYYHAGYYIKQSAYKMSFAMALKSTYSHRSIGGSSYPRPQSNEHNVPARWGLRLSCESGSIYYLDEDGSWQSEEVIIEESVSTSEGSERKIEIEGFPESGLLQFFIVQCLSGYSSSRDSFWQTVAFNNMSLTLDTEDDYDHELEYSLSVNSANNSDMDISLPIADIPNIPNDRLIYSLYFTNSEGLPTRMWHSKSKADYNSLVNHLVGCALNYKQLPAKRISGEMFTGKHIDMNTVVQDDRFLKAGFYINSIELDALGDSYNSELVEMPSLLQSDIPAEGDDCVQLKTLSFIIKSAVKCTNQIVLLSVDNTLYTFDTITRTIKRICECESSARLFPADDAFVLCSESSIKVYDYRGICIKTKEMDYLAPATYMGSCIYGVSRFNIGRGGGVVWSYNLGLLDGSARESYERVSGVGSSGGTTSFGTDPPIVGSIVKSYASLVLNTSKGAYLFDRRIHQGLSTTHFANSEIISLSDYFMVRVESNSLKIYRRDTISEQTLVKTISCTPTHCDHTLSEFAFSQNNAAIQLWDYRSNSTTSVINAQGSGQALKGLFYINGSLYIVRDNALYKYAPNQNQ